MTDRRRPLLVNRHEVAADTALREAAARCGARICPKVRVADALHISRSGLSPDEYSYALKAHFDFVVASAEAGGHLSAFAVEFDGPQHSTDPDARRRDGLKGRICDQLGMPLLRVDAGYLRRLGRFTLLGWLAELWFMNEAFCDAQRRGQVPQDEVFDYAAVVSAVERGRLVPFPYDPFRSARLGLIRWSDQYRRGPETLYGQDPDGYAVMVEMLRLTDDAVIIGIGRCRSFRFPPVAPTELAADLAVVDAVEKLERHRRGEHRPARADEAAAWAHRMAQWEERGGWHLKA